MWNMTTSFCGRQALEPKGERRKLDTNSHPQR